MDEDEKVNLVYLCLRRAFFSPRLRQLFLRVFVIFRLSLCVIEGKAKKESVPDILARKNVMPSNLNLFV